MTATSGLNMLGLLGKTSEMIVGAPEIPVSPGYLIGSRPVLCAGGILVARAAADGSPTGDFDQVGAEIVRRGRSYIIEMAEELELDRSLVEAIVIGNDALNDAERREGILAFIQDLASKLADA